LAPAWFSRRSSSTSSGGGPPEGLWEKCVKCERMIFSRDLERNLKVCPYCDYHFRLSAPERIELLTDEGSFEEWDASLRSTDPLNFPGYPERLERERKRTGLLEACITGKARIGGYSVALGVTDSRFLMGAMNSVVGEKITRCVERATEQRLPLILVSGTGGGASMFEGILSLMQMPKTCAALARHHKARLLYIAILTDPTMAGVLASWASVGDIILAEPGALIGFTGERVSRQANVGKRPPHFQTAEFQLEHGMIDAVVPRKDLKPTLEKILRWVNGEATPSSLESLLL
jgi:acetyl-CoA carboxylase carboxyl transferase subunit beta